MSILIYSAIGVGFTLFMVWAFAWVGKQEYANDPRRDEEEMVAACGDESLIKLYRAAVGDAERAEIAGFVRESLARKSAPSGLSPEEQLEQAQVAFAQAQPSATPLFTPEEASARSAEFAARADQAVASLLMGAGLGLTGGGNELEEDKAFDEAQLAAAAEQAAAEAERVAAEQAAAEAERIAAEQAAMEAERIAAERAAAEAERIAAERAAAEAERIAAEQAAAEAERIAAEQAAAEAERIAAEQAAAEAERIAAEQAAAEAERIAAERAAAKAAEPGWEPLVSPDLELCHYCGSPLEPGCQFCIICGMPIELAVASSESAVADDTELAVAGSEPAVAKDSESAVTEDIEPAVADDTELAVAGSEPAVAENIEPAAAENIELAATEEPVTETGPAAVSSGPVAASGELAAAKEPAEELNSDQNITAQTLEAATAQIAAEAAAVAAEIAALKEQVDFWSMDREPTPEPVEKASAAKPLWEDTSAVAPQELRNQEILASVRELERRILSEVDGRLAASPQPKEK